MEGRTCNINNSLDKEILIELKKQEALQVNLPEDKELPDGVEPGESVKKDINMNAELVDGPNNLYCF